MDMKMKLDAVHGFGAFPLNSGIIYKNYFKI